MSEEKITGPYSGGAFHKDLDGEKLSGTIRIYPGQMAFDSEVKKIKFPMDGIIIRKGGANNRLFFFEHPFSPGCSIFTSDSSIVKNPFFKENIDSKKEIKKEIKKSFKRSFLIFMIFFFIILILFGLYQLKKPLTKFIARKIPAEWEKKLGKTVLDQYKNEKKFLSDPFIVSNIRKITDPVLDSINSERYKFFINISKDPSINAFALPGGYIVINTGLILAVKNPEELAGVLAHEVAHVTLQHGFRKIITSAGLSIIMSSIFGETQGLLAVISDNGSYLLDRKFSRDYEREADNLGFQFLSKANIDPSGMITFFEKLTNIEKNRNGIEQAINQLNFLSTHPETEERIKRLSKMLTKAENTKNYYKFKIDFKRFQEKLKDKLKTY